MQVLDGQSIVEMDGEGYGWAINRINTGGVKMIWTIIIIIFLLLKGAGDLFKPSGRN